MQITYWAYFFKKNFCGITKIFTDLCLFKLYCGKFQTFWQVRVQHTTLYWLSNMGSYQHFTWSILWQIPDIRSYLVCIIAEAQCRSCRDLLGHFRRCTVLSARTLEGSKRMGGVSIVLGRRPVSSVGKTQASRLAEMWIRQDPRTILSDLIFKVQKQLVVLFFQTFTDLAIIYSKEIVIKSFPWLNLALLGWLISYPCLKVLWLFQEKGILFDQPTSGRYCLQLHQNM